MVFIFVTVTVIKLCSHSVAVAYVNGELNQFMDVFTKKRRQPNLTKSALHGLPAGPGRKGGQPPKKRARKTTVDSTVPFQPATTAASSIASCQPSMVTPGSTQPSTCFV